MQFYILAPTGRDGRRWRELVERLPPERQDIHFGPEYASIQSMLGVQPFLAVAETNGEFVMQPFVKRGVEIADGMFDIASPYGYGGPVSNIVGLGSAPQLFGAFADWCRAEKIVDEYCVLHPFVETHQRFLLRTEIAAQKKKDTVFIWLTGDFSENYRRDRRAAIERARRGGVVIDRVEPTTENISAFCELYRETMLRKKASARWYFPDEYLRAHFGWTNEIADLFFARIGDKVEVASLVVHGYGTAYYHLTGNRMSEPKLGANDLLIHEIAVWARRAGYGRLHLGGGVTSSPDDPLLEYKAGFSNYRAPVYSFFRIFDADRYNELCAAKCAQEIAHRGQEIVSDFQPAYRREAA